MKPLAMLVAGVFVLAIVVNRAYNGPIPASEDTPPPKLTLRDADRYFERQYWVNAARAYEAVTAADPGNGQVWFRLGYSLHAAGELGRAIAAHRRAAEFPEFRPIALYNVGCAHALRGEADAALAALGEAIDAGFRNKGQVDGDPDLDSLRDDARFAALVVKLIPPPDPRRQFDFWVGEWDVFHPSGRIVGTNVVRRIEDGHALQENWTSADGRTGQSMTYRDPSDGKWWRVWVEVSGAVGRFEGGFSDGAMRLVGDAILPNGTATRARLTFTPLPDGRLRQVYERSRDQGETWSTEFDVYYVRQTRRNGRPGPPSGHAGRFP